jgi:CheY-like chemotaxis protein
MTARKPGTSVPGSDATTQDRPGARSPKHVTWGSTSRILVAEEDESYASMVATVLQGQGYRVDVARSAAAALESLRQSRYGLVLVHYGLPDRTGVELLQEARDAGLLEDVAELLFTGKPSVDAPDEVTVLHKPVDLQDLVRQIHSMVGPPEGPGPPPPSGIDRRRKTAEARQARARHGAKIELALYVTLPWPSSLRAQANISRVLAGVRKGEVRLDVCDLAHEPDRAERDNVLFSPTLVKVWPEPKMWILGDLSEPAVLTDLLIMCGVETSGPAVRT